MYSIRCTPHIAMKTAVISDIHGHWTGLEIVLRTLPHEMLTALFVSVIWLKVVTIMIKWLNLSGQAIL